jgi:transglutaminase-like putative cysteine protease
MPEFLYVLSQAIVQLSESNTKDVGIITGVKAPGSPSGDSINSKQLTKANYVTMAKNIANYIKTNKQAPNYASSAVGKIIYTELVDAASRVVAFYGNNGNTMPAYVVITTNSGGGGGGSSQSGVNEKNTMSQSELAQFLKKTTHCEVGNSKIKSKVQSLTKGLTTDSAKANAIYNFVRDKISYTFYYDTKHGAVGTLDAGSGNCVDQAHLLIAMFRTAGLHARYVHGTCKFSSGSTYGHVWAQVLIGNTWTVADPTSTRNSLGKIANWNTNSFTLKGKYPEILF